MTLFSLRQPLGQRLRAVATSARSRGLFEDDETEGRSGGSALARRLPPATACGPARRPPPHGAARPRLRRRPAAIAVWRAIARGRLRRSSTGRYFVPAPARSSGHVARFASRFERALGASRTGAELPPASTRRLQRAGRGPRPPARGRPRPEGHRLRVRVRPSTRRDSNDKDAPAELLPTTSRTTIRSTWNQVDAILRGPGLGQHGEGKLLSDVAVPALASGRQGARRGLRGRWRWPRHHLTTRPRCTRCSASPSRRVQGGADHQLLRRGAPGGAPTCSGCSCRRQRHGGGSASGSVRRRACCGRHEFGQNTSNSSRTHLPTNLDYASWSGSSLGLTDRVQHVSLAAAPRPAVAMVDLGRAPTTMSTRWRTRSTMSPRGKQRRRGGLDADGIGSSVTRNGAPRPRALPTATPRDADAISSDGHADPDATPVPRDPTHTQPLRCPGHRPERPPRSPDTHSNAHSGAPNTHSSHTPVPRRRPKRPRRPPAATPRRCRPHAAADRDADAKPTRTHSRLHGRPRPGPLRRRHRPRRPAIVRSISTANGSRPRSRWPVRGAMGLRARRLALAASAVEAGCTRCDGPSDRGLSDVDRPTARHRRERAGLPLTDGSWCCAGCSGVRGDALVSGLVAPGSCTRCDGGGDRGHTCRPLLRLDLGNGG